MTAHDRPDRNPLLVVMGVSGSGKSTVGDRIATELGVVFVDADDLHPAVNKDKMGRGIPLTDDDRWPWLHIVGQRLAVAENAGLVVACSALKRSYRDLLREEAPDVVFVHLRGTQEFISARMSARVHEFMPNSLLESQFATLELPADDEAHIDVDLTLSPDEIAAFVAAAVRVPAA